MNSNFIIGECSRNFIWNFSRNFVCNYAFGRLSQKADCIFYIRNVLLLMVALCVLMFGGEAHASMLDKLQFNQFTVYWLIALGAPAVALILYSAAHVFSLRKTKMQLDETTIWEDKGAKLHEAAVERHAYNQPKAMGRGGLRFENSSPGDLFKDSVEGLAMPEMVVVPPGCFIMGSPPDEEGRNAFSEGQQREVTISKPFAVSRHLITFEQYDAFCWDRRWATCGDEGWGRGALPIINVSWIDAYEYVKWLSAKTGKMYRLMSEAEWEYCCRAGSQTAFSFGETISADQANYNGSYVYGDGHKGEFRGQTTPVDFFPPNAFGLHDMHGNVWEWVEDVWSEGYAGAPNDETPALSGDRERRALRGGSWYSLPVFLRSANRVRYVRDFRDDDIGFRVACTL